MTDMVSSPGIGAMPLLRRADQRWLDERLGSQHDRSGAKQAPPPGSTGGRETVEAVQ